MDSPGAYVIPWNELETCYANCFDPGKKGKLAFNAWIALGSLLIQTILKTTDQETEEPLYSIRMFSANKRQPTAG